MHQECRERFSRHRLQWKPLVSDPGMHHGTCVWIMAWHRIGAKPLFELMLTATSTYICGSRQRWVKRPCLTNIGIPIIKTKRSWDCRILIIGIRILVRRHIYIWLASWLCFYQTRSAWSRDQGSNKNHSPAYNFTPTVTKFCVMWEGQIW